jgi:predicted metal-dependent peptidase
LPFKPEETVLCLIDTSGSVNDKDIRAFLSEIFELKTAASGFGDSASEVIVLSADTVLRGEPIEITDANCDELMSNGVKVFGRGGTSLGNSLKQAVALPMFKDKKIKSVVYFTDLYDTVPQYKDLGLPTDDVAMMFIAAPSTGSQHVAEFAKGVEGWARVAEINEGIEIDISETSMDMPVAPASRRRPGR